jgi:uncharacterized membrane protein
MNSIENNIKRVHFIDEVRGVLILYIVWYHLMYDLTVIYGLDMDWVGSAWMEYIRLTAVSLFVIISGVSCHYSRSNIRRGIKTILWGMVITLCTILVAPDQVILFGILHFMGTAMLLCGLLQNKINEIPVKAGIIISLLLFILTYNIYDGYIGIAGIGTIKIHSMFYNKPYLFPFGFSSIGVESADYYPIFPWLFLFLAGNFFGRGIKRNQAPFFFYNAHSTTLSKIGRHTLIIYLLHQPIILILLFIIFKGV